MRIPLDAADRKAEDVPAMQELLLGWAEEIWAPVKGYEGLYQVSTFGRIFSHQKRTRGTCHNGKFLRGGLSSSYPYFWAIRESRRQKVFIHRAVGVAFILNPLNKPNINHKNGIRSDNQVNNLEWCTQAENIQHAYATGLMHHSTSLLIKENCSKLGKKSRALTMDKAARMRIMYPNKSIYRIAKEMGVSYTIAWKIIRNQSYLEE